MLDASNLVCINIHVKASDDPLDGALQLLGEVMEIRNLNPQHLVVCGGAALRALKIVSRTTRDVDVLAFRGDVDGEINMAWPLCDEFLEFFTAEQQPKFREIVTAVSHGK